MSPCPHSQWFEVIGRDTEWMLVDPKRLRSIENLLPDPAGQKPMLIFFIGKSRKALTMKKIFTQNNLSRSKSHGIANLFLDFGTDKNDHPWLIADCTLNATAANQFSPWNGCHENRRLEIDPGESDAKKELDAVVANLHANLIIPLTHVVVLFAADFGGNGPCRDHVRRWMSARHLASSRWRVPAPALIVVSEDPSTMDVLVQLECEAEVSNMFESLTIVTVDHLLPPTLTAQKLQGVLRAATNEVQKHRLENHLLFSASQLKRVVHHGVQAFTENPDCGLDVLSSSDHPAAALLAPTLTLHLTSFLRHAERLNFAPSTVSSLIASALLKQGYPHFLHCISDRPRALKRTLTCSRFSTETCV